MNSTTRPVRAPGAVRRALWLAVAGLILLAAGARLVASGTASTQGPIHVVEISGTIDLGLAPYLERALQAAEDDAAAAVLLEVDTPGGRLDAVLQMQSSLVGARVRTIAFVNRMALSAGALVTIAAEEIYVAPGSTLGAATPVVAGELADEKTISAVRSTFRATAEARGRNPRVAEAMVDADIAIEGLIERGKLLTLDPDEALEWGYAEAIHADRAAVLEAAGLEDADVVRTSPTAAESVVRFLTNPALASVLITLGMLLVIADFLSGGIGIAAGAGGVLLAIFFWGHLLAGLAGWEDVALVVIGLVLIALELLVFPGVGLPGVLGLAAVLGGLFLAQLSRDLITPQQIQRAATTVGVTFVAVVVGLVIAVRYLARHGPPSALVLQAQVGSGEPVTERATGGWLRWFGGQELVLDGGAGTAEPSEPVEAEPDSLVGRLGVALSDLRPSGIADIDGERVDVVTSGEYISAGERIEVVRDEGYRRVVRRAAADSALGRE
jgi:membrane-bound serine protease (ClpP class)